MEVVKRFIKSPSVKMGLITGGIILTKVAAFYIYKEMRKEKMDLIVDI
ncbi:MAG TPA: hypothetical protein PKK61_14205 [Defluviitaleaceae bacterium]|mgnify:CR=1 FL=1|nr:hypothetical protein [Defluviitaleaceae bacterium]